MINFNEIRDLINNAHTIGLSYHVSPDGDATGSLLGLFCALKKMNKDVKIFSKDNLTLNRTLRYLPEIENVDGNTYEVSDDIDMLIILDCGNIERVSCDVNFDKVTTVCIDHHISNGKYCTYNFIEDSASSTGEIVFQLINHLDVEIDKDIAKCIYTSIMTDTGGLRFESTSQKTFNIVGELISTGIDFWNIYEGLFLKKEYSKIKLLGLVFDELKVVDDEICVIYLTQEMLDKSNADETQTGDIVSTGLTIENVKASILIKDFKDKVKVSLRGKDGINVCEIAGKFGGGGHIKAAAFVTDLSREEIESKLIEEFRAILK